MPNKFRNVVGLLPRTQGSKHTVGLEGLGLELAYIPSIYMPLAKLRYMTMWQKPNIVFPIVYYSGRQTILLFPCIGHICHLPKESVLSSPITILRVFNDRDHQECVIVTHRSGYGPCRCNDLSTDMTSCLSPPT